MKKQGVLSFCMLLVISSLLAVQSHRAAKSQQKLTEIYRGAVLSAIQQMDDMHYNLKKAMVAGQSGEGLTYLSHVSDSAGQAQRSLSLLPLSHPDTMQAVKLTNQLMDYASALMEAQSLSGDDIRQLSSLILLCRDYAGMLYDSEEKLMLLSHEPASFYPSQETETLDAALSYPTLIYDGPFSDARIEKPLPFEGEKEITWEEAGHIAREFIGRDRVLSLSHGAEIFGPNPCFGITLQLKDITLEAAVTKKGGKVLWIATDNGAFESHYAIEHCITAARQFLQRNGFPEMENTFFQVYEGVAVIAFAAKQGDVLLYPDLVKVQLRMDTAEVVGFESKNFWQHHKARSSLSPLLTEDDAKESVSSLLSVTQSQLCLIPLDDKEILCWEFSGTYQGTQYLVYINAENGRQENLLQIVESGTGLEAV